MVRPLLLSFLLLAGVVASAQQSGSEKSTKYFNQTEVGVGFGLGHFKSNVTNGYQAEVKNSEVPISLQTVNGFVFNDRVGAGVGIGVEFWKNGMFYPLFGQLSYNFKQQENTFFVAGNLGYSFGSRDSTISYNKGTGGFTGGFSLGYQMKVAKRLRFMYELYYKYQALSSYYYITYADTTLPRTKTDYTTPLSFLGLRIGIIFR